MNWSEEVEMNDSKNIECIVTRYTEHLNWLNYLPTDVTKITIHNKNENNNRFFTNGFSSVYSSKIQEVNCNNVGRHSETIARYILENYDNLPDVMMFVPGNVMMTPKKGLYLSHMCKNIKNIDQFHGFYSPKFIKVGKKYDYVPRLEDDTSLTDSKYKSFNEWKDTIVSNTNVRFVSYRGMMVVKKENVLFHPREVYLKIFESLQDGNFTYNVLFAERFWCYLFKNINVIK